MMRRITLFVAAVAAYTLLGMALASATKLVDKDADWAGPVEATRLQKIVGAIEYQGLVLPGSA